MKVKSENCHRKAASNQLAICDDDELRKLIVLHCCNN